jgi:hypothetical protein
MGTSAFDPAAFDASFDTISGLLTEDDLLAVVDRVIPESYLQPIKEVGPGYELYQGSAMVGARCSIAVRRFELDGDILTSRGGTLATVPVTFYRADATAGAVRVLAGTVVSCSRGGQSFRTTSDAVFGPVDTEAPPVTARALGYGYEYNIRGPFFDERGGSAPGDLDTIDLPLMDPVFGDPSIQARNDLDADGQGRPRTLDLIGGERDLQRQPNETDTNYRARIMTLPDTVSPAAIKRQVTNYVRQIPGLFWRHVETWDRAYQECFDAPEVASPPGVGYDPTMFVPDDPRAPSPIRNRYLGHNDYLGAVIIEIAAPPHIAEYGFALDDPADTLADVSSTVGVRAFAAYDVPDTLPAPALVPSFDGRDYGIQSFLAGLFSVLERIKAGGVFVVIHLQET